jgi:hypothetical protein
VSLREVFGTDLALLHAPSVYDFRTSVIMHGPIADAVPSTNEFDVEAYLAGMLHQTRARYQEESTTAAGHHGARELLAARIART